MLYFICWTVVQSLERKWSRSVVSNSLNMLKFMFIESMTPSHHFILCHLFSSCPQSFPVSGSFSMSQFFASGSPSVGALASAPVLPVNIQGWFLLGLAGSTRISLLSKGLSGVLQHHSSKASILWRSAFFTVHLSYPFWCTGNKH